MADTEVKEVQNEAQPAEQPQTEQAGLTLQDLVLVAQIIQLTSQRGAYRAEELANVGNLYNKLVAFLESTGAISRTPAEGATQENINA